MLLTLEEIIAVTDGVPNGIRLYRKVERAVIEKLGTSAAVPVSPMAKMAQVLREKAKREREDYERRVQSGEWGPAPDAGTEADHSPTHVATVEGDESQRVLHWNKDVRGFDYEPGDKLYDATALAQARQQGYEAARAEHVWRPIGDAPKDGSTILLRGAAIADGYWLQAAYNGNGAWIWPYIHSEPRFWMPLPAEPAQEKS